MKPVFKVLLSLLVLLVVSGVGGYFYMRQKFAAQPNQLVVSRLPLTTAFVWQPLPNLPHGTLLVPVQLPGCPRPCYLQFDTGSQNTLLYSKPLAALRAQYPALQASLQPAGDSLRNFRFALGGTEILSRRARLLEYGTSELPAATDSAARLVIGTLGTDVLEGRVLLLDYARESFSLCARVPDSLARRASFSPLAFTSRKLLLSGTVQGETKQFLWDSGTSAYALLTSQANWQALAQPGQPDRVTGVNSWGKTLTSHTVATGATLGLGTAALPLGTVTYLEGVTFAQRMMMVFSGMGGMLGNAVFGGQTIIVDVAGQRFGVVPAAGN